MSLRANIQLAKLRTVCWKPHTWSRTCEASQRILMDDWQMTCNGIFWVMACSQLTISSL